MFWFICLIFLFIVFFGGIYPAIQEKKQKKIIARMSPEYQKAYYKQKKQQENNCLAQSNYGKINEAMLCPHCNTAGKIRTKDIEQKKGVSGGKATAAVLTGGLSLLAVGLSRKEGATQAHCDNCRNTWFF
jgi:uncharacterized paraquat-inducible protein A